jgi:hypothetical protein
MQASRQGAIDGYERDRDIKQGKKEQHCITEYVPGVAPR